MQRSHRSSCAPDCRGRLLDLHWHLLDAPKVRDAYVLPTEPLLARRRAISSGLPALDPADQLVHVAVQAAQSGATRLSWLLDTILSLRQYLAIIEASAAARSGAFS